MKEKKINLVLFNISVEGGFSGVNRYLEMISRSMAGVEGVVVHTVYFIEKKTMLFPRIDYDGEKLQAQIPLPINTNLVIKEDFWMSKYSGVVADLLQPYFREKTNLIWNLHCINLSRIAVILRERHGGTILSYLHCIPWKFEIESNMASFKLRYRKFLNRDYKNFNDSPIERLTYDVADRIVCVTHSARFYLEKCMGVPVEKIDIVPNGILDVLPGGDLSMQERGKGGKTMLLYVGRISKEKGVPALLEALRRVKRAGYDVALTLAGVGHGSMVKELEEKYADLDLNFTGRLLFDELVEHYRTCSIGVIPSLHEQCSYVAMEMAMFGVPIVATDVDGLGEMFIDKQTALKVPLKFDDLAGLDVDVDRLAQAIVRLIKDRRLRDRLGMNARQYYLEHFTAGLMLENSLEIYKKMIYA